MPRLRPPGLRRPDSLSPLPARRPAPKQMRVFAGLYVTRAISPRGSTGSSCGSPAEPIGSQDTRPLPGSVPPVGQDQRRSRPCYALPRHG